MKWSCKKSYRVVHLLKIGGGKIVGFRDDWLRKFFVDDAHSRNIPSDLEARLFRKLQMIDDAVTDQALRVPPSIISRSCAVIWRASIGSASTSNDG